MSSRMTEETLEQAESLVKESVTKAEKRGEKRIIYRALLILAVLLLLVIVAFAGYGVKYVTASMKEASILQVRGALVSVKSFEVFGKDGSVTFKYLWLIRVEEDESVAGFETNLPKLKPGDTISVEIKDSRANLYVTTEPIKCYQAPGSSVRVCDYEIDKRYDYVMVFITEFKSSSSNQYELSGVPR